MKRSTVFLIALIAGIASRVTTVYLLPSIPAFRGISRIDNRHIDDVCYREEIAGDCQAQASGSKKCNSCTDWIGDSLCSDFQVIVFSLG